VNGIPNPSCDGQFSLRRLRHRRALAAIDEALGACVIRAGKDGAPVDLGPDHYARLAAVGALPKAMTAGWPVPPRRNDDDGTMTLAELEASVG
jgi:hypothetical protein